MPVLAAALPSRNGWSTAAIAGLISLPIAYAAVTECYRYYIVRQRHAAYTHFLKTRTGNVFDDLREAVVARFATLRGPLTGRYLNVTFEWHEQSIYEFLLHQLVYKPLTGRIWWYGGLSKDPAVREASLPQETVDIQQLKRRSWRSSKRRLSPSAQNTTPSESDEWEELAESPSSDDATDTLSFTWLGQSTCIVQIDGITILTDPVFTDKPIAHWLAPSRLRETPISLQELMEADIIDICIVSHDHFDHASEEAVQQLGNKALWVCPQDLSHFFVSNGVHPSRVIEMTWWDERTVNVPGADVILQLACTPAQHWSGRGLRDVNQSLWAGFIVKSVRTGKSFFHCGDTGYSKDLYEAVGRIYAPITVAAIPVGSYSPVWYMKNFHTTPKGAVRIHRQLGIQQSVAVHWGTWMMSDERWDDPPKELAKQLQEQGVNEESFVVLPAGRTISVE